MTPRQGQELASSQPLNASIDEFPERSLSMGSNVSHLQPGVSGDALPPSHESSPAVMPPPPNPAGASAGSPLGAPSPPSQDEARRALELVMHFFQHQPSGVVDPQEYITMGKLMEKLKVQGNPGELPGGMHSIGDFSGGGTKEMSRKRSIHSL